jgi:hypothetical protein
MSHHFFQSLEATIMHVWLGESDIPHTLSLTRNYRQPTFLGKSV